MAHKNYRRKNKQNHHGAPNWYGKPDKYQRKNKRRMVRQRDRLFIIEGRYDDIWETKKLIDEWW